MKKQGRNPVNRKLIESGGAFASPPAQSGRVLSPRCSSMTVEGGNTVYVPPDPPEAIVFAGVTVRKSRSGALLEKAADAPQ